MLTVEQMRVIAKAFEAKHEAQYQNQALVYVGIGLPIVNDIPTIAVCLATQAAVKTVKAQLPTQFDFEGVSYPIAVERRDFPRAL